MSVSCPAGTGRPAAPVPTKRDLVIYLVLALWLWLGYSASLIAVAHLRWAALWQAAVYVLVSVPLLWCVITVLSFPKKLVRVAPDVYRAVSPALALSQYLLPWVGWSALIWWMNGGGLSAVSALETGAALAAFSYASGFALLMSLRPRAGGVEVTRTDVSIGGLPQAFDGYRILQISDLHGGSRLVAASVSARLEAAAGLDPDLVVFTGDLAARAERVKSVAQALGRLRARDGLLAVLGNHDHWVGEERVVSALAGAGFTVLRNEHRPIEHNGDVIYLVGVKDPTYLRQDNLPAALQGVPDGPVVILLSHSPDVVRRPLAGRASLILSGHTHGGQMVFPWTGPLYVPTRLGRWRMAGLVTVDGRVVYINRGLGEVFPPMRLNCPPEVALITLRRS